MKQFCMENEIMPEDCPECDDYKKSSCNGFYPSSLPEVYKLNCPFCQIGGIEEVGGVFIEKGRWLEHKDIYEEEGDGTEYRCINCKKKFILWD